MREIVVCGEALVDIVATTTAGGSGTLPALAPALGGGPFNVAVTLGRLGGAVSFCSAVSTDAFGDSIIAALENSGVGTTLVQRRPEPTTLALTAIGDDGAARYSFYTEGTADRLVVDPGRLAPTVSAMCFGTLSLVLEPGASAYEALMQRAHAAGKLIALDPNIRPAVIDDADSYRRRFAGWMSVVDLVKLSDEDAEWLADGPAGTTVDDWLAAGVGAVVTTAGAAGITITTRRFTVEAPAPIVTVADTIGAGDSVMGALLRGLDSRGALTASSLVGLLADDWRAIGEFAGQVAAVTVSRPGADPPWASELRSD